MGRIDRAECGEGDDRMRNPRVRFKNITTASVFAIARAYPAGTRIEIPRENFEWLDAEVRRNYPVEVADDVPCYAVRVGAVYFIRQSAA